MMDADGSFGRLVKQVQLWGKTPLPYACDATDSLEYCTKNVYGRIVAEGEGSLQNLSSSKDRKTVFLFGEDAIKSLVLRKSPYDSLIELGLTPDYIHYKVLQKFAFQ